MKRHEALVLANQLLADPTFGYVEHRGVGRHPWSPSALSATLNLLQSTLAPDGSEPPDALRKGLHLVHQLASAGFEAGLAEQLKSISQTLLTSQGNEYRLRPPVLQQVTQLTDLILVLSYLRRLWPSRRPEPSGDEPFQVQAAAKAASLAPPRQGVARTPVKPIEPVTDPRLAKLAEWMKQNGQQ